MLPGSPILCSVFYAQDDPSNSLYCSRSSILGGGIARFLTPHGCECDLLLVLDLKKPTFAIVSVGARVMFASAFSREASRTV